jgi:hypothetical protein
MSKAVTTFGIVNFLLGGGMAALLITVLSSIPMDYLIRNQADALAVMLVGLACIGAMFSGYGVFFRRFWARPLTLIVGVAWSVFSILFSVVLLLNERNLLTVLGPFLVLYWFFCVLVVTNRVNRWEFKR